MEFAQLNSEQIVAELKRSQRSRDVVDVEEERVKVIIFTCGGNQYAFYGKDIREFLPACVISWVPGLPDYLPGLINVRGDIESVIDISYFLGETAADRNSLVAMAVRDDFRSGIMIDAIIDVVDMPRSALLNLEGAASELISGTVEYGTAAIPLLDIGKLAIKITL
jgi:purine-binding chemotaxis protein CheW